MKKYTVTFKHVEETVYTGWVEANSLGEVYQIVEDIPFDVNDLEAIDAQGIDVKDVYVEEMEEEE